MFFQTSNSLIADNFDYFGNETFYLHILLSLFFACSFNSSIPVYNFSMDNDKDCWGRRLYGGKP